jgi:hypothetical protein
MGGFGKRFEEKDGNGDKAELGQNKRTVGRIFER